MVGKTPPDVTFVWGGPPWVQHKSTPTETPYCVECRCLYEGPHDPLCWYANPPGKKICRVWYRSESCVLSRGHDGQHCTPTLIELDRLRALKERALHFLRETISDLCNCVGAKACDAHELIADMEAI